MREKHYQTLSKGLSVDSLKALEELFVYISNKEDWKAPIDFLISSEYIFINQWSKKDIIDAVKLFHHSEAEVIIEERGYRVVSPGLVKEE